ncbi:response regulator [Limnochorda pilosa]|uniref:MerR family transcriptional regulator n=1 Tax=Limnochorda pilosa TaxID=1555112 RepID=A0A0K2SN08_LIMPI|nr:response regulator transcription factor [Limnochorda pilosa]BAS28518.1 MerR family transcriptional regulator [Limnochorda pilosa]
MIRVLLADDKHEVRSALALLVQEQAGMSVAAEAAEAEGLLQAVQETHPDVVLLDWELPGPGGRQLLAALRRVAPGVRVVALSGRSEARQAAVQAGADAFASKGEPPERLLEILHSFGG